MPGAPFIYYGDEIGMAYRWIPTKEGGYHRTGSRTPMQWDESANLGFSTAAKENLYLPVDPNPGNATVAAQEADPDSMLNHVRKVLALRKAHPDLGNYTPFEVVYAREGDKLMVCKRGEYLLAVNPGVEVRTFAVDGEYELVHSFGNAALEKGTLTVGGRTLTIWKPVK